MSVFVGQGRPKSPVNEGFSVLYQEMINRAESVSGAAAFIEEEEEEDAALIVFGLCLSIPFVVLSSSLLSKLMDRYNWVMYLGAAILGKVGGEMIVTDPYVERTLRPTEMAVHGAEAGSIALIFAAVLAIRMTRKTAED